MSSEKRRELCRSCGRTAEHRCSGCLSVSYCSKEHQRLDWKQHKSQCVPFQVVETEELGRCLIARRDIRLGEIVLRERPLLTGPAQNTGPVCLGCLCGLEGSSGSVPCDRCGWPLCSLDCRSADSHRPECDWTVEKRKEKVRISNFCTPHPTYGCLFPLRLLHAKHSRPELWAKISTLESHTAERVKDGTWEADRFAVANLLRRFYRLEELVTEEEILEIAGIIQINGHEVPLSEPPHIALYWRCSFLEHSCIPNCSKSFSESGEVVIRTGRALQKGDHLSISYTDPLWGTPSRLHHLQVTKYFTCTCTRCSDVTERGTYFSALNCSDRECLGKLLPSSFFDPAAQWECNICESSLTADLVSSKLSGEAERLLAVDKTKPQACKEYLDLGTCLPENHYHRVEMKLSLAQLIGQTDGGLGSVAEPWLELKVALCRELLRFCEILLPAEVRIHGVLNFELHAGLAEQARRQALRGSAFSLSSQLLETRDYLEKAIELLQHEARQLPEGRLCRQAVQNLADLDRLLASLSLSLPSGI